MRVLIPSAIYEDSFADNVAFTLRQMGHEVFDLGETKSSGLGRFARRQLESVERRLGAGPTLEDRRVVLRAREVRPDLVLALTRALPAETLDDLRRAGVSRLVAWWGDAPANMQQMGLLVDGWDRIYLKDPDAVRKLRSVGLPAELLFEAMNPEWHRPLGDARNGALAVVGNFYAFRQILVRRLIDAGVDVGLYGGRPPRWCDPVVARLHTGREVRREAKSRVFHEALACLNSMHVVEGNSLNCRAFEIAGAAGLQLIEHRPIIEQAFEPGREVWVFQSVDEIVDHLERARRSPAEADRIREAGHRRALAEHTYRHRLERLLPRGGSS